MDTFVYIALFQLVLMAGLGIGWVAAVNFIAYMEHTRHDFEDLFEKNPHPEIYEDDGKIYRGEYMNLIFEPGYDPEEFDPSDVQIDEEEG